MSEELFPPQFIDLIKKSDTLKITWKNGETCSIATEDLRRYCACSSCRSKNLIGVRLITAFHEVKSLDLMGASGIQITFADGHDRGVYPWAYLNAISKGQAEAYIRE